MKTNKLVSYIKGKYYKKEEWIFNRGQGFYQGYHREDGPALIYYYKGGAVAVERWYRDNHLSRPIEEGPAATEYYKNGNIKLMQWTCSEPGTPKKMISYYENGNVKCESNSEYTDPKNPYASHIKWTKVEYYEDGTIKEKSNNGTFKEIDSKYRMYMDDSYNAEYYENGNIKSEKRGINKNCSLDKPIIAEYDIDGNILKAKYFLYDIGYITQTQLNKYNKQLHSKRKLRTSDPKALEILYYLAKKYNYTDKIGQIEELLILNKSAEN